MQRDILDLSLRYFSTISFWKNANTVSTEKLHFCMKMIFALYNVGKIYTFSQFHEHFTSSFLPNFFFAKDAKTVSR